MGFECWQVAQGWADLGIELPPLAPASRRPTPVLACARGEGQGSAEQRGGRVGGLGSHADDDRARWGRRKQGCRETRIRPPPPGCVHPVSRRPRTRRRQTPSSPGVSSPYVSDGSFWPVVTAASREPRRALRIQLSGEGDGRRPTGAGGRRPHAPSAGAPRRTQPRAPLRSPPAGGRRATGGHGSPATTIIWRIYKRWGKTRRS